MPFTQELLFFTRSGERAHHAPIDHTRSHSAIASFLPKKNHLLNQINASAIRLGQINLENLEDKERLDNLPLGLRGN
ncbi:MAG TPA: hypothetical protein V6D50_19760 [Chroococcales cyanobacterium]